MKKEHDLNLMLNDVQKQYANLRKSGKSRDAAITIIKRTYAEAMEDEEDSLAVMITISKIVLIKAVILNHTPFVKFSGG